MNKVFLIAIVLIVIVFVTFTVYIVREYSKSKKIKDAQKAKYRREHPFTDKTALDRITEIALKAPDNFKFFGTLNPNNKIELIAYNIWYLIRYCNKCGCNLTIDIHYITQKLTVIASQLGIPSEQHAERIYLFREEHWKAINIPGTEFLFQWGYLFISIWSNPLKVIGDERLFVRQVRNIDGEVLADFKKDLSKELKWAEKELQKLM